jgi:phosphoribosyl 1,2-cyclic phosphate phosphodiesterase
MVTGHGTDATTDNGHQNLQLTILGCGSSPGCPVIGCDCPVCKSGNPKNHRTRSSALITFPQGQHLVIDTATEFRLQILRHDVSNIEHVIYTHTHSDHCQGFDDLRAFFFRNKAKITIHATREHLDDLETRFSYAFKQTRYHGTKPDVVLHEIKSETAFEIFGLEVEPVTVAHGDMNTTILRFGSLVYATDFKEIPAPVIARWTGKIHTMVASGLRMTPHPTHSSLPETVNMMKKIKIKQGVITHLGHEIDYDATEKQLPANIRLAFDGLSVVCPLVL